MASLNARKPYRVLVHEIVDGRDIVKCRFRYATRREADQAYEDLELEGDEFAEVVAPLFEEPAA